jgi:recombination protein RecT
MSNLQRLSDYKQLAIQKLSELGYNESAALREFVNFLTYVNQNEQLKTLHANALVSAFLQGISLGVSFNPIAQHIAIVPYKGRPQLQLMYQGLIYLVRNADENIRDIYAEIVYDCDEFDIELGVNQTLKHKPRIPRPENAQAIGVYAVAVFKDNSIKFTFLHASEIEAVKKIAKTKYVWDGDFWAEMWKKTAIRRLIKTMPKIAIAIPDALQVDNESFDLSQQEQSSDLDELIEFEIEQPKQKEKTVKQKKNDTDGTTTKTASSN